MLSVIVLEGISGIGKTALAARFASSAPHCGYEPFWLDCRSDTSFNSVTSALASFAQSSGHDGLAQALEDPGGTLEERIARISAGVAEHALALFFDDYHLVTDPLVNRLVHKIGERSLRSKVFLICRQRPRMAVISSPRLLVEETLHEGIDFAACTEYLLGCGLDVPNEVMRKIWSVTGEGHPKALEIFVARSRAYPVSDLLSSLPVFREELTNVWLAPLVDEFPQEQKDVAIDLSTFDRVIPLRALPWLYPDKDVRPLILGLVDRFILDFVPNESLRMHMLIREFCYPQLPDKAAKHSWVAEYYLHEAESAANPEAPTEEEIIARTAAWIHLLKAEDHARARVQLQKLRSPLMNRGQYEQVMFLLDNTPTTPETELWWTIDRARIRGLWGEFEAAVEILRPLTGSADLAVASESVLVLATLYLEAKDGAAALAVLERYHDRFTRTIVDPTATRNVTRARRRFLSRLIEAHLMLGDSQRAYDWAKNMIEVCQVEGDEFGGALSLRQMAGVLVERGEHTTAIQLYRASVDLLRKKEREREIGITQRLLGTAYLAVGDFPSSQHYLEDAMRIFTAMGDRPNSSICRLEMRKLRDAQLASAKILSDTDEIGV